MKSLQRLESHYLLKMRQLIVSVLAALKSLLLVQGTLVVVVVHEDPSSRTHLVVSVGSATFGASGLISAHRSPTGSHTAQAHTTEINPWGSLAHHNKANLPGAVVCVQPAGGEGEAQVRWGSRSGIS